MTGKIAALRAPRRVRWEKLAETRPFVSRLCSLGLHAALGFMGGCVRLPGNCAPFGIALTAVSGCGGGGRCCMLGAAAGYVATGGLAWGVRYASALLLVFTAGFVFRDTPAMDKRWFLPAAVGVITAMTGALSYFESLSPLRTSVALGTEVALAVVCTVLFSLSLATERCENEQEERRRRMGQALLLCCAVAALCRWKLWPGVVPGRGLAVLGVMLCAFFGGSAAGALAATALGAGVEAALGSSVWGVSCALAAALAGAVRRRGRVAFTLLFALSFLLCLFWGEEGWKALICGGEVLLCCAVFLLLPKSALGALRVWSGEGSGDAAALSRRYLARRTRQLSSAFRSLYDTVHRSAADGGSDENMANMYDRAAESVCHDCPKKGECWHRDYIDTLTLLNDATLSVKRRGRLTLDELPPRFREKCVRSEAFLAAVNGEWRAMNYRRRLKARLSENRTAAYGQYRFLAAVLDEVAEELSRGGETDEFAREQLMRCLRSMELEGEAAVFRDGSGRLHAVIEGEAADALEKEEGYLDRLSRAIGVRLCRWTEDATPGRLSLLEAEPLAAGVGIAALQKEGESVSGDKSTFFKTEQGVLCVLLSDGMGSRESAAKESMDTVHILEGLLRAGVDPATAMEMLNSLMLLKNGEEWGYATVDLMCVDLFTGTVDFYKYGAAPSYLRTGRSVRRVKGISLAAGILMGEGEMPDVIHMSLPEGGWALIASDGVISPDSDGWIRQRLLDYDGADPRELAGEILREAEERCGCGDDMTVLCVHVEVR